MNHKIYENVKDFMYQNKGKLILYFFLLMSFPISDVILPHFYGKLLEGIKTNQNLTKNIKIIAGLWMLVLGMQYSTNMLDANFKPQFKSFVRKNFVENIIDDYKENYKEQEIGDIIAKLIKLPAVLSDIIHQLRNYIVPTIFIFIVAVGYFWYINPRLGILALVGITFLITFIVNSIKNCIDHAREMDNINDMLHEDISDILENLSSIYSSSTYAKEIFRIDEFQEKFNFNYGNTIKCSAKFNLIFSIAFLTIFSGLIYYAYNMQQNGQITMAEFSSIFIVVLYIISHLKSTTSEVRDFIYNIGVVEKTQKYMDEIYKLRTKTQGEKKDIKSGNIYVEGLYMKYPQSEKWLLENFNTNIQNGERVALVGKIGSGKSSFVKVLMKFFPYQKGKVLIDEKDIRVLDTQHLREQIMYVPQQPKLFNRTLYENIVYGLDVDIEKVEKLMRELNLDSIFGNIKLNENVGKKGEKLSGGQKQVVYLLRCFLRDCSIVILDEPTSALDESNKHFIMSLMTRLTRGKTVLMITHDNEALEYVDRKIYF